MSEDARQSVARRRATLSSQLGLGEKLFTSAEERRFADEIEQGLVLVEEGLMRELTFGDALADVTARYLFEAGGKRIRPALALLTAQLGKGNTDAVITAAQAIEMTHLASLYHDDVMDDAQLRRGVPTVQTVWGNSVAILTGDLLFARAARLVAGLGDKVAKIQSVTFERLCLGQLHETIGPGEGDDPVEHYLQVLSDKTGSLIATASQIGVLLSDAPDDYQQPVLVYGEKIGVAFQLIDDVIDLMDGGTGKLAGTDIRAGVATLPMLYLQRQAATDADAAELLAQLHVAAAPAANPATPDTAADAEFDAAIARLREHDVTRRTVEEAHRWADEGIAALDDLPDGPVRKALTKFAEGLLERTN